LHRNREQCVESEVGGGFSHQCEAHRLQDILIRNFLTAFSLPPKALGNSHDAERVGAAWMANPPQL